MRVPAHKHSFSIRKPGCIYHKQPGRFLILCLGLLLSSCTLDLGTEPSLEEERIPETAMYNLKQTRVRDFLKEMEVKADSVLSFPDEDLLEFQELRFREFTDEGSQRSQGRVGRVLYNSAANSIECQKGLLLKIEEQDEEPIILQCDELLWSRDDERIEAPEENLVIIDYASRGKLQGRGFSAESDTETIYFTAGVRYEE